MKKEIAGANGTKTSVISHQDSVFTTAFPRRYVKYGYAESGKLAVRDTFKADPEEL